VRILRADADTEDVPVEAANPYAAELDDFARAIREGGEPRLGRADAVGQARTIGALFRAAREGGGVTV
jgi:predicted dehydrogenase